jgi:hypothetical protein
MFTRRAPEFVLKEAEESDPKPGATPSSRSDRSLAETDAAHLLDLLGRPRRAINIEQAPDEAQGSENDTDQAMPRRQHFNPPYTVEAMRHRSAYVYDCKRATLPDLVPFQWAPDRDFE